MTESTWAAPLYRLIIHSFIHLCSGAFWKKILAYHRAGHLLGVSRIDGKGYQGNLLVEYSW